MSRELLWRQLRAAVRAGETDEANKAAIRLGYVDAAMRRRLLAAIHKQEVRRARS